MMHVGAVANAAVAVIGVVCWYLLVFHHVEGVDVLDAEGAGERIVKFDVLAVDASNRSATDPVARLTLGLAAAQPEALSLEELLRSPAVAFFALDWSLSFFVFLELADPPAAWREPPLDRCIPRHAGKVAWSVPLFEVERWAQSRALPAALWVWSPGGCGRAPARAVLAAAAVVAGSCWAEQLGAARPRLPERQLQRLLRASWALEAHLAARQAPSGEPLLAVLPGPLGYRLLDLAEGLGPGQRSLFLHGPVDEAVEGSYGELASGLSGLGRALLAAEPLHWALRLLLPRRAPLSTELSQRRAAGTLPAVDDPLAELAVLDALDGAALWSEARRASPGGAAAACPELASQNPERRGAAEGAVLAWVLGAAPGSAPVESAAERLRGLQAAAGLPQPEQSAGPRPPARALEQARRAAADVPTG
ncbi:unnamed protein product, partial [Prorocentrum cordatum]